MSKNMLIIAVVVVVLVAGGAFLFTRNNGQTDQSAIEPANEEIMAEPTPETTGAESSPSGDAESSSEVKEFTVTGSGFKFDPATLTVNQGDTVRITFKNAGGMHDLVIDEFNVKTKVIQTGQEETVEFTADQAGTFDYYCSVANHREMGMVGKLVVQ